MQEAGFSPTSVRPFRVNDEPFAAVTWTQNPAEFVFEKDLTRDQLKSKFDEFQSQDMLMLDFAEYQIPGTDNSLQQRRWLGVWRKEPGSSNSQTLTLWDEELREGFAPVRACMHIDPSSGEHTYSLLSNRTDDSASETYYSDRMQCATGDAYPGYCLDDLRVITTLGDAERGQNYRNYLDRLNETQQGSTKVSDQIALAKWSSAIGKPDEALKLLQPLVEDDFSKAKKLPEATLRGLIRVVALVYARSGRTDELEKLLNDHFNLNELTKSDQNFPRLCLALLKKDFGGVPPLLSELENAADESSFAEEYYLRALAWIAAQETPELDSAGSFAKLLARAPLSLAKHGVLQSTLLDVDFDPLRSRPQWLQLLETVKLSRSVARCFSLRDNMESQEIVCLPLKEHENKAIQLSEEGFAPTCVNVNANMNGNLVVTSVWNRKRRSTEQIVKDSRRMAASHSPWQK